MGGAMPIEDFIIDMSAIREGVPNDGDGIN
jgi:hypothetical protein